MQIEIRHFGENLSRGQWSAARDDVESSNSLSAVFCKRLLLHSSTLLKL